MPIDYSGYYYGDPFQKCWECNQTSPLPKQQLAADFNTAVREYVDTLNTTIYEKELFGHDAEEQYDILNSISYLLTLLLMIYDEQEEDAKYDFYDGTGCGNDQGADYYVEKYNIACLKKYFFCHDIDISEALDVFGLDPDNLEQNGIGFMYIEINNGAGCDIQRPPFEVQ